MVTQTTKSTPQTRLAQLAKRWLQRWEVDGTLPNPGVVIAPANGGIDDGASYTTIDRTPDFVKEANAGWISAPPYSNDFKKSSRD